MSEHLLRTIADLETDVRAQEQTVAELKRTINHLCKRAGIAPKFAEGEIQSGGVAAPSTTMIAPDQFTGKPLNTAIRTFLTMRKSSGGQGPASVEEIHDALQRGGYEFETKDKSAAINGLRISLGKSTVTFKKLPNGLYGLHEWYGTKPKPKGKPADETAGAAEALDADDAADEEIATP